MSEMVKRVANAIFDAANRVAAEYDDELCSEEMALAAARAAIAAMRDPTESDLSAGLQVFYDLDGGVRPETIVRLIFERTLESALEEAGAEAPAE